MARLASGLPPRAASRPPPTTRAVTTPQPPLAASIRSSNMRPPSRETLIDPAQRCGPGNRRLRRIDRRYMVGAAQGARAQTTPVVDRNYDARAPPPRQAGRCGTATRRPTSAHYGRNGQSLSGQPSSTPVVSIGQRRRSAGTRSTGDQRDATESDAVDSERHERIDLVALEVAHQERGAEVGDDPGGQAADQRRAELRSELGPKELRNFERRRGQDDRGGQQEAEARRRLVPQ